MLGRRTISRYANADGSGAARLLNIDLIFFLLCLAMPIHSNRVHAVGLDVARPLTRIMTLEELGFSSGLTFSGLVGSRELFFRAPREGLIGATLRLKLQSGAAFPGKRYLQIIVGGRVLLSQPLAENDSSNAISLPIDPAQAENGFLRITLRYSGALQTDRCIDERVAGDFLNIASDSTLVMELSAEATAEVDSLINLMPRNVSLMMPDRELENSEIVALLRTAAFLRRNGSTVALTTQAAMPAITNGAWENGLVLIGKAEDFQGKIARNDIPDGITAVATGWGPALFLSGQGADNAIALLASQFRPLTGKASVKVDELAETSGDERHVSFGAFGFPLQSGELDRRAEFDLSFASDQLPGGMTLEAIRLEMAVGASPSEDLGEATIFAFLNGRLLASRRTNGSVPAILSFSVPHGLMGRNNALKVRVQRPARPGSCTDPAPGQPVQLLPSSSFIFTPAGDSPRQFLALPQLFRSGVDVILPVEPAPRREALTALMNIAVDMLPVDAPLHIRMEEGTVPGERPFLLVSQNEPGGTNPHLRFDRGGVRITRGDGKVLLALAQPGDEPTVAQLVSNDATTGLWLRPGKDVPSLGNRPAISLDRGNVALIDEAGISLAFSTENEQTVSIAYHQIRSWTDMAGEYWPWIVGAVWLLITALFARIISGFYRRRSQ